MKVLSIPHGTEWIARAIEWSVRQRPWTQLPNGSFSNAR